MPPKVQEVVEVLKQKIQTTLVLVFLDKPFLLETDASKEGLVAVLSQKQDDGHYHPVAFGSHSLTPAENYHSSKLEFLVLKWSMMEQVSRNTWCTHHCGEDGQQPADIHPHHPQLGCHWA